LYRRLAEHLRVEAEQPDAVARRELAEEDAQAVLRLVDLRLLAHRAGCVEDEHHVRGLAVRALRDDSRINAVVVLTDGQDNQSDISLSSLVSQLRSHNQQSEQQVVRVFTIAYGDGAERDKLAQIAKASGGEEFSGDPTEIEAVYRTISSFF
jgi:Ca-activated chloride channel family protein